MDYVVAIPSYRRAKTLREKTLALLERHNIPAEKITIFVGNQEEYETYRKEIPEQYNIVVGQVGMGAIRRFIQNYYPEGTQVMNFDDDLSEVMKKIDDKTMVPVTDLAGEVICRGFVECQKNEAYLFGVYAAANAMFMKNRVAVGLYYCIGSCWGLITRHDKDLTVSLDDKEDFERTLQHYVKDGKVVRLDDITVKSKYYTEDGGMQVTRTDDRILESAKILAERYPELCSMYIRETTGHAELRLRDTRKNKNVGSTLDSFF
jgi:hypothetical protein